MHKMLSDPQVPLLGIYIVSKAIPVSITCQEDSQDSAYSSTHRYDLLHHNVKGYRAKSANGKGAHGLKTCKSQRQVSKFYPSGLTQKQDILKALVNCCLQGKFTRDSAPRVFNGLWSLGQPLLSTHQMFRFPEGKQVFIINHIFYISSLGTVSYSSE